MNVEVKKLPGGQVELCIEASIPETDPYLRRASERLAQKHQVPGFRVGKAPSSVIRSRLGDMAVYEEAAQELIPQMFSKAVHDQQLETVGAPHTTIEKLAPGNPVVFKATVAVAPTITLERWREVTVQRRAVTVTDEEVDALVEELRNLQAKETLVTRPAQHGDKVEINFEMYRNSIVVEGGKGTRVPVVIGKKVMIPGFEEQLVGMSAGGKKTFQLTFPSPYHQEHLAGADIEFHIEVASVFERILPEKNDTWAQAVIGKQYQELISMLRTNLTQEKELKEQQRLEYELMEKILERASFSDIPDMLISAEIAKMMQELQDDTGKRGMKWNEYLTSIKRTEDDLKQEFRSYAEKRVKSAFLLRKFSQEFSISVDHDALEREIELHKERYSKHEEALKQLRQPEYRQYLRQVLINRKTIDHLLSLLSK